MLATENFRNLISVNLRNKQKVPCKSTVGTFSVNVRIFVNSVPYKLLRACLYKSFCVWYSTWTATWMSAGESRRVSELRLDLDTRNSYYDCIFYHVTCPHVLSSINIILVAISAFVLRWTQFNKDCKTSCIDYSNESNLVQAIITFSCFTCCP